MTISNDSVAITPGSGATIATHLVGGKEYQVVMPADENGNIIGSRNTYFYNIVSQVHVASANAVHWALFNATTSVVRITSIKQIPNITTAVTGIVFNWKLARTTAIGTGGTAQSAWLADLSQSALNENITMILKPSGGANEGVKMALMAIKEKRIHQAAGHHRHHHPLKQISPFLR